MIDSHLHLGKDEVYDDRDTTEEMLDGALKINGLKGCVLFPSNTNVSKEKERAHNERVRIYANNSSFQVFGICQVNPHYEDAEYHEEISRYIKEGFRGISVNPEVYGWNPMSSSGERVFKTAHKFNVPIFANIGVGMPFGIPINYLPMCKKYADVKVVLLHTGKSIYANQADMLGEICPNVYFETSLGMNIRQIKSYISKFGAQRVIMGSAIIEEVAHSIYSYDKCDITDDERAWCTGKSILSVLGVTEVQL